MHLYLQVVVLLCLLEECTTSAKSFLRAAQLSPQALQHQPETPPTLVTFADDVQDARVKFLLSTADHYGWKNVEAIEDPGFKAKPPYWAKRAMAFKQLVDSAESDSKIFLFVDGFDSMIVGPPEELVSTYQNKFGLDSVVYQCCKYRWPRSCPAWIQPPQGKWGVKDFGACSWANAGLFMGSAKALRQLFSTELASLFEKHSPSNPLQDDQCAVNWAFSYGHSLLKLDTEHELFYGSVWDTSINCKIQANGRRFQDVKTGNFPIVFHLDGGRPTLGTLQALFALRTLPDGMKICRQFEPEPLLLATNMSVNSSSGASDDIEDSRLFYETVKNSSEAL
jgi:hypothetical protein